eukprot:6451296-Amphidinium_carterae.1
MGVIVRGFHGLRSCEGLVEFVNVPHMLTNTRVQQPSEGLKERARLPISFCVDEDSTVVAAQTLNGRWQENGAELQLHQHDVLPSSLQH